MIHLHELIFIINSGKMSRDPTLDSTRQFLRDPNSVDIKTRDKILSRAGVDRDYNLISKLLEDPRVDKAGNRAAAALSKSRYVDESEYIDVLLRSKNLDLRKIRSSDMERIVKVNIGNLLDSIEGSAWLGDEFDAIPVLSDTESCTSFAECHYDMLLRELILKRLDLEYYLRWILKHLLSQDTSAETNRLFSGAANSLLDDQPVVHMSTLFTAYRGFFLLTVSDIFKRGIGRGILDLLSEEQGVTREGLILTGILLGAYLGRESLK